MAIASLEILRLTAEDVRVLGELERRVDQYLATNWAGPERPFDTGITDLKWNICEELRKLYSAVGWSVSFQHPVNFVTQTFSTLDGSSKPRSLPTLISFRPSFDTTDEPAHVESKSSRKMRLSTATRSKKAKKGARK